MGLKSINRAGPPPKLHHLGGAWPSEQWDLRDKVFALSVVALAPAQAQAVLDYYRAKDAL